MHQKEKFEDICNLICNLQPDDDGIIVSRKMRKISEKFRLNITTENSLSEMFDVLNSKALADGEAFIRKLVIFITSKQMENFAVNGKIIRHAILTVLQKNFQNSQKMKNESLNKFYNSIELLGYLFNSMRLQSGHTINIIGSSMLQIINVELEKEIRSICHLQQDSFAKLVLNQIAINGTLLQKRHKSEVEKVLSTIRRVLIEIHTLSPKTKAYFLMTFDLVNSNFGSLGYALENMYKIWLEGDIKVETESKIESDKTTRTTEDIPTTRTRKTSQLAPLKNVKEVTRRSNSSEKQSPAPLNSPRSPQKKTSPNGLRTKKSPIGKGAKESSSKSIETKEKIKCKEPAEVSSDQNENDDLNIPLRQFNSTSTTPVNNKYKPTKPIYFREENVENLTWNGESENETENVENQSKSPKTTSGYSTSDFLNFLSSN